MTPYEKQKQRDKEMRINQIGNLIIRYSDDNDIKGVLFLLGRKVDKDGLCEYLNLRGRRDLIDKINDIVFTAENHFNELIELLMSNCYHDFFTKYLSVNANMRDIFKMYIEKDRCIYWKYQPKSDIARLLLSKIEIIENAEHLNMKNVVSIKLDKESVYFLEKRCLGEIFMCRRALKRKAPNGLLKELKDGQFVFVEKELYKLVIISKNLYSEPNNVRLLKF